MSEGRSIGHYSVSQPYRIVKTRKLERIEGQ